MIQPDPIGIRTVNLVRREELVDELRAAGGDVVLVDGPGIARRVADATISLAFDGVAGDATSSLASCLAPGGQLVFYAGMSGKPGTANPIHVIFGGVNLTGFWLGHPRWKDIPEVKAHRATGIRLIAEGKLRVAIAAVYPLSEARAAIEHAQRGGKVLFQPTG